MNDANIQGPTTATGESSNGSQSAMLVAMFRRPWVKIALVMIVAIALIAAGFFIYANRPVSVHVAALEKDIGVRVFGLGTVEARVRSSVGFEVGATLVELKADHGDRVRKGDVLARLNSGEQEAKVAKANAALTSAQANINKANANLVRARAIFAQKQETNLRKQSLVGRDVVSKETAGEAQSEVDVANADVSVATSEIEVAKAMLTDAQAQVQFEQTMLRHRTLVAPYDGIVIERHKELGTVVKSGDPIFSLIAADTYWGLAYVDEARAGFIRLGQKVDARLRSRPQDAFTGSVARIGLESDRVTEERRVFIKGDNPPQRVYLGEQVEFWITVAQLDRALLVPEAAVQGYDRLQGKVWTVEAGRLHLRTVTFGHRTEDARLEILGDLPPGAKVVTRLNKGFREGRSARIIETSPK